MKGCASTCSSGRGGCRWAFSRHGFWPELAAVGLPIWLHLLKKHRSTPQPFSSLMFFEQHIQSSIKHKRLRYLVLFALRTALVALLALAFAKPYIHRSALPVSRAGEVTADRGGQFAEHEGGRPAGARQADGEIGHRRAWGPGQRAQVMAFGSRLQAMSELTDDHARPERRRGRH